MNISDTRWKQFLFGICFIFSLCNPCSGQEGFNLSYEIGKSIWLKKIEFANENELVLNGVYYNDSSQWVNMVLIYIDTNGQIKKITEIEDPLKNSHLTVENESGFIINQDTSAVLPFAFFDRNTLGLAIVDSDGELKTVNEFPAETGSTISPYNIIECSDGYLITGWISIPPSYKINAFVLKTDRFGNEKWLKQYGTNQFNEYARTITIINSNFYLISGVKYLQEGNIDFSLGWAVAIDSLGNQKWDWVADSTTGVPSNGIFSLQYDLLNNELIYFTYYKRQTTNPGNIYEVSTPVYVKCDTLMNLIAYNDFGTYAINHYMAVLEKSHDGGWIAAGNTTSTTDDYISPSKSASGEVIKLANDGEMEWMVIDTAHFNDNFDTRSYLSGLTESESGSIYAIGWANNLNQDSIYRWYGWLLKISADGCVDTICSTEALHEQIKNYNEKIRLYPNPVSENLTVDISKELGINYYLEIYDLTGKLWLHELILFNSESISISELNDGLHYWRLTDIHGYTKAIGKILVNKLK